MIKTENEIRVTYENAAVFDNKLYFTEMHRNELYSYDITKKETTLICRIDSEDVKARLFGAVIPYGDEIFLIPFSAECMYKVNLKTGIYESIEIRTVNGENIFAFLSGAKFLSAHLYENKIYLMPTTYPAIVEYNFETGEMQYYDSWIREAVDNYNPSENAFFRKTMLLGESIYAPFCGKNAVLKFNVVTKETQILSVGSKSCAYSSICFDGNRFWLSPRGKNPVVEWDEKSGEVWEYSNFPEYYEAKDGSFADIIALGKTIVLLPIGATMALEVTGHAEEIRQFDLNCDRISFMSYCKFESKVYFFAANKGLLFIYDTDNAQFEERCIKFPDGIEKDCWKEFWYSYNVFRGNREAGQELFVEEYDDALQDYISYVGQKVYHNQNEKEHIKETIGWKVLNGIFDFL